jgi:hypothetical protein
MYCVTLIASWKKKKSRACDYDCGNGIRRDTFNDPSRLKRIWALGGEL